MFLSCTDSTHLEGEWEKQRQTPGFCSHAVNFAKFHKRPWRWPPEKACWPLRCKYIRYREIHLLSWEELDTVSLSHTCQTVAVELCIRGWDGHSGPGHLKHLTECALSIELLKTDLGPLCSWRYFSHLAGWLENSVLWSVCRMELMTEESSVMPLARILQKWMCLWEG